MQYTENYNLKKPESDDFYNVGDFNENSDIIDEYLAKGVQAYTLVNSLISRVTTLESSNNDLKTKAKVQILVYAPSGTSVTLGRAGYGNQAFTVGSTQRALKEMTSGGIGEYTATYTYGGVTRSKTINVLTPGTTKATLAPTLEASPWEYIQIVSEAGLAEECWSVGDTKSITLGGEAVTVRILGFNHDLLSEPGTGNGKRAGITFALTDTLATKVQMHSSTKVGGNYVDWCDRDLLTTHLPARLSSMDSALQAAIKTVSKAYLIPENVGSSNTYATTGKGGELLDSKLFLLSEREIFGEARLSNPYYSYDRQYEYYRRANNFKCTVDYWLRNQTWNANDSEYVNILQTDGKIVSSLLTAEQGLIFGFCV